MDKHMIPLPPEGWKEAKHKDDELIGYIMRQAWARDKEALRYDEVALVLRLAADYRTSNTSPH